MAKVRGNILKPNKWINKLNLILSSKNYLVSNISLTGIKYICCVKQQLCELNCFQHNLYHVR